MGKTKKLKDGSGVKIIRKPSFGSPFCVTWPEISKHENHKIIEEIKREIPKYLEGRTLAKSEGKFHQSQNKPFEDHIKKQPYKEFILLGINAVTKALESGPLSLVLVCKSAKPALMTHHLIPLCVMRNTDGCCVAGLSGAISAVLEMKSVLAVGFKMKQENPLSDLIAYIKDKAPSLEVPWMNIWKGNPQPAASKLGLQNVQIKGTQKTLENNSHKTNELKTPLTDKCGGEYGDETATSKIELNVETGCQKKADESYSESCNENIEGPPHTDIPCKKQSTITTSHQHTANTDNAAMRKAMLCPNSPGIDFPVKRNMENVSYKLIRTNYQMFEKPIKKRK